ncbi:ead/Ea22-like family protein [Klebsiella pneumoniae]|uniref:ead/Ea22-like family protein n=1 Tax=Klebsiella pneumoniae TaxID=573 RepID=UPI001E4E76EA|nr:ead/Ea22-like family protein [Klebsiella pneumoniae]MCC4984483.1 ead/Ea22-like family protein [Klebsiella pneumoniae]
MTDITELAQSLKAAAENAGADCWQAKKISGDFYVIRKGSYKRECGYTTYQPIAEIDHKPTRDYVAMANPANILALVEALEKAQQQTTESENRVRKQNRHICELFDDNTALRQRIAELESRTVTVKLPDINEYLAEVHDKTLNRAFRLLAEGVRAGDVAAMRAAGIKVEAE